MADRLSEFAAKERAEKERKKRSPAAMESEQECDASFKFVDDKVGPIFETALSTTERAIKLLNLESERYSNPTQGRRLSYGRWEPTEFRIDYVTTENRWFRMKVLDDLAIVELTCCEDVSGGVFQQWRIPATSINAEFIDECLKWALTKEGHPWPDDPLPVIRERKKRGFLGLFKR